MQKRQAVTTLRHIASILLLLLLPCFAFAQLPISQHTKVYFDSTRNRKLVTEIWRPQLKQTAKLPLIMFSHGTGGNRLACRWFCEGMAQKGFMVVAVDHFGNTFDNPLPKEFITFWQRPRDITYVLSNILSSKEFSTSVNQSRIYMAGFSLGGYTSLALAGATLDCQALVNFIHTPQGRKEIDVPEMPGLLPLFQQVGYEDVCTNNSDLRDNRVRAVFVMSPAIGQGFPSKKNLTQVTIPVAIVGAAADSVAPIKTNAWHYKKLLPTARWHLVAGNAGHYVFLNEGTSELKKQAPVFFKDVYGVNRAEIHRDIIKRAYKFFSQHN